MQTCLDNLTRLVNSLLSSKIDNRISPWLAGAPLTALHKKTGGPIAVGEVLHRLTSHACCCSIKSRLSDVLLRYGQMGVGGLEAAVHTAQTFIENHGHEETFKVDMKNAFNECDRETFCRPLHQDFPELVS